MAKDNKVRLPSSSAGITQYFDNAKSKYMIKPMHVVIMASIVIVLILILEM